MNSTFTTTWEQEHAFAKIRELGGQSPTLKAVAPLLKSSQKSLYHKFERGNSPFIVKHDSKRTLLVDLQAAHRFLIEQNMLARKVMHECFIEFLLESKTKETLPVGRG
jgi:hypothetical protein